MPNRLRKLILGVHPYIPSRSKYKRVVLTSQLSLLTLVICLIFFTIDAFYQTIGYALPFHFGCAFMAIASFILNRKGQHTVAKILLALAVNFSIYLFSEREPMEIGLYMFFIVANIGTIAAFGFEEKKLAIGFITLSFILFTISLYTDIDILPRVSGDAEYIKFNIFLNFLICFVSSAVIIYFLINLNNRSEEALLENEQQMLLKNEELTKLNAELDRFMYSTSHDLRSPISSVLGLIQLTRMTDDREEIKTYVEMMEERLASLNKFIKDISDYSRNARTEVNHEKVYPHKVILEIVENLKFYPGAGKVKVEVNIDAGFNIVTDSTRFRIIFGNLISNSFKYIDPYKENPFIKVSVNAHPNRVEFTLEDNGLGISDKYLPKIFDMFFQAHEKSEGSGLGLYIVKEAIDKLKGTITAKSKLEVGTSFEVILPV
jgi:signal transduction histidine kinase